MQEQLAAGTAVYQKLGSLLMIRLEDPSWSSPFSILQHQALRLSIMASKVPLAAHMSYDMNQNHVELSYIVQLTQILCSAGAGRHGMEVRARRTRKFSSIHCTRVVRLGLTHSGLTAANLQQPINNDF
jgi:hypothetical protein